MIPEVREILAGQLVRVAAIVAGQAPHVGKVDSPTHDDLSARITFDGDAVSEEYRRGGARWVLWSLCEARKRIREDAEHGTS